MIAVLLFVAAGLSYLLASYWREESVGDKGTVWPGRASLYLTINTVCLTIAAAAVAGVHMISIVVS